MGRDVEWSGAQVSDAQSEVSVAYLAREARRSFFSARASFVTYGWV